MQPYQRAGEETRRQSEAPLRLAKTGLSVAGSVAGTAALGRVMPLLNELIPQSLAIKGLSKIDPRFGKFINTVLDNGGSFDEAKEFIKGKAESSQQKAPDQRSIIEQYSPELNQYMKDKIQKGISPTQAAHLADVSGKFKEAINKMSKDHKTPFLSIVQSIFGGGQQAQAQPQQAQAQPAQRQNIPFKGLNPKFQNSRNIAQEQMPPQMQSQSPAQQADPGNQAMMAIIQKINARLGQ